MSFKRNKCWKVKIEARPDRQHGVIPLGKHARRKRIFQNMKYGKGRKGYMDKMKVKINILSYPILRSELVWVMSRSQFMKVIEAVKICDPK